MIRTMMKVGLLGYRTRFKTLHMMLVLVSCGDMICMVILQRGSCTQDAVESGYEGCKAWSERHR